jgi:hypothetical protein
MFHALTTTKSVAQHTRDTAIGEGDRQAAPGSDVQLKNLEHQVVVPMELVLDDEPLFDRERVAEIVTGGA